MWTSKGPLYVPIMIFRMANKLEDWERPQKQLFSLFIFSHFWNFCEKCQFLPHFFSKKGEKGTKELILKLKSIMAWLPHGQGSLMQNLAYFGAEMNPQFSTSSFCMLWYRSFQFFKFWIFKLRIFRFRNFKSQFPISNFPFQFWFWVFS